MATNNPPLRTPGNFSSAVGPVSTSRLDLSRGGHSSSIENLVESRPQKPRLNTSDLQSFNSPISAQVQPPRPLYALSQGNVSASSLHSFNFSRPTIHSNNNRAEPSQRLPHQTPTQKSSNPDYHRSGRKHSSTQGSFEAYLPTTANNNLSNMANSSNGLNSGQIATQTTMQHHVHARQRSQTLASSQQESNGWRAPTIGSINAPKSNLTESSTSYGSELDSQAYHNGMSGGAHTNSANTAVISAYPKSPASPHSAPSSDQTIDKDKEKPVKSEKSKVKLFSRPTKIGTSKDKENKAASAPLPSPNIINYIPMQRGNYSTMSITDSQSSASSIYTNANSSLTTIRPIESEERKLEKEKYKHHFLSRQKHKLTSKDDHNLPLSSAASNSKPVDPSAPSSIYNFNMPLSPTLTSSSFAKSMSGLDLRHGGRALREKKKEEKAENIFREVEISHQNFVADRTGSNNVGNGGVTSFLAATSINHVSSICGYDASAEIVKNGLDRLGPEDAWPFLKTKLLVVFEGEDLRLPVEDLNRVVLLHLQTACRRRTQIKNLSDNLSDLLTSGFTILDQSLRSTPDEKLITKLAEMWVLTFTAILPFMQAVFLPLDHEFSKYMSSSQQENPSQVDLSVRSILLRSYRDVMILSRFDILKDLFSRLHLENISSNTPGQSTPSPFSELSSARPGTPISLDPGIASLGSQTANLVESTTQLSRNRALSNMSCQATSISSGPGGSRLRERERVTENNGRLMTGIIGRLLQCIGVLNSVHNDAAEDTKDGESIKEKMSELVKDLRLEWLQNEKVKRDMRGWVGARARVPVSGFGTAIEV